MPKVAKNSKRVTRALLRNMISDSDIRRFFLKVNKGKDCWNWTAFKRCGYGQTGLKDFVVSAHRLSYLIHKGDIPQGLIIRHTCDNPSCVNPEHLIIGTDKDNKRDQMDRDRHYPIWDYNKGSKNGSAKLDEAKVLEIRRLYVPRKVTHKMLGNQFGVSEKMIKLIVTGKAWKHVKCKVAV